MNSVQMHLALTHVPVVLSVVSLIMLAVAFFIKNGNVTKISYVFLLIAGIVAIPVFLTGEGAEEAVGNVARVSEAVIGRHEEMANLSMIAIGVAGIVALAALFSFKRQIAARVFKVVVLLLAISSGVLMVETAHLGGQIRHSEIKDNIALQNTNEIGGKNESNAGQQKPKDDD